MAILEMISSQAPKDRILWILTNSDSKLERSDLRRRMGMRYADLDPVLDELEKESRITRLTTPLGKEMIIINADNRTKAR